MYVCVWLGVIAAHSPTHSPWNGDQDTENGLRSKVGPILLSDDGDGDDAQTFNPLPLEPAEWPIQLARIHLPNGNLISTIFSIFFSRSAFRFLFFCGGLVWCALRWHSLILWLRCHGVCVLRYRIRYSMFARKLCSTFKSAQQRPGCDDGAGEKCI